MNNINAFMNGYFPEGRSDPMFEEAKNRMEPKGPNRYLKTDKDIRNYMQKDRQIVSSILVESAISVLQRDFKFTHEQIQTFHAELQKEISDR